MWGFLCPPTKAALAVSRASWWKTFYYALAVARWWAASSIYSFVFAWLSRAESPEGGATLSMPP